MDDTIKRLNYFDHQFLQAKDFNDEQQYHLQQRRTHNRVLHRWGIADGLAVLPDAESGEWKVTITPGMAIDASGREIILKESRTIELKEMLKNPELYVTIEYSEKQTDPSEEGGRGPTRWSENPITTVSPTRPESEDSQIILAKLITKGAEKPDVNGDDRRQAGARGGDLRVRSLTLSKRDEPGDGPEPRLSPIDDQNVELSGGLTIKGENLTVEGQADFLNQIRVGGNLSKDTVSLDVTGTLKTDRLIVADREYFDSGWFPVKNRGNAFRKNQDSPPYAIKHGLEAVPAMVQVYFTPAKNQKILDDSPPQYLAQPMDRKGDHGYCLRVTKEEFTIWTGILSVGCYWDERGYDPPKAKSGQEQDPPEAQSDAEGFYRIIAYKG